MKVLFLGGDTHPLAVACVSALIAAGHDVTVAMQPRRGARQALDVLRRRGVRGLARRGFRVLRAGARGGSVSEIARRHGLATLEIEDPNAATTIGDVALRGFDLTVVANYARILRRPFLRATRLGAVNVHPSVLPAYRGPDPIYWMHANGEREGGLTVHLIDAGIDSGPILVQRRFAIAPGETEAGILRAAVTEAGPAVTRAVNLLERGPVTAVQQPARGASYYGPAPRGASAL